MSPALHNTYCVIPTLNAARNFQCLLPALAAQGLEPDRVLVVDSASTDHTAEYARAFGARVFVIHRKDFNHGGTRTLAAKMLPDAEFLIYLTQDAIPANEEAFLRIIAPFANEAVGMTYGRQLPHKGARAIEGHARIFNYPAQPGVRTLADRARLGIKTIFCSNSFAAYRYSALEATGFFPSRSYFAEDQVVASRMILDGLLMAYASDATVHHSHSYTIMQDFKRYFDVGVFHAHNRWLLETFGQAEGEGLRFMFSELGYLLRREPQSIPSAILRNIAKYAGYRVGQNEAKLHNNIKARLSAQPSYWRNL